MSPAPLWVIYFLYGYPKWATNVSLQGKDFVAQRVIELTVKVSNFTDARKNSLC